MIVYVYFCLYTSYFSTSPMGSWGHAIPPFLISDSKMGSIVCISLVHDYIRLFSFVHLLRPVHTGTVCHVVVVWHGLPCGRGLTRSQDHVVTCNTWDKMQVHTLTRSNQMLSDCVRYMRLVESDHARPRRV